MVFPTLNDQTTYRQSRPQQNEAEPHEHADTGENSGDK